MWWTRKREPSQAEILALKTLALEGNAARAGAALGCCYANSREYEAELIAARRAAGVYGRSGRHWRVHGFGIAAGIAVIVTLILLFK